LISPWLLAAVYYVGSRVRRLLRRPAISIESVYQQDCATTIHGQPGPTTAFARLLISNRERRDAAHGAHVVVVSHRAIRPLVEPPVEIRMALSWTHSDSTLATIHGGSPRCIDPVAAEQRHLTAFLTTSPRAVGPPIGQFESVNGRRWLVDLELVADGMRPIR
jgi:hypothetical protein